MPLQILHPKKYPYIFNEQKVAWYERRLEEMEASAERNLVLYDYGLELMRAGNTNKAIEVFENFHNFFKDRMFPNKEKIINDFKTQLAIGYLRKGEQDNCIRNHHRESCIIPLSDQAQHIDTTGSAQAIAYLEECLELNPFDYELQYLYNIAQMTLGAYPDQVPEELRIPEEYFQQDSFPYFPDIAMDLGVDVNELSGGICMDDFNQDGYLDLVVSSWMSTDQIRYFEHDQQGGFIDQTASTGLVGVTGGLNLKHADYNNDGYMDLIILRGAWLEDYGKIPNSLIRNNGDGTFTDVTIEAGMYSTRPTQSAVWADFNLDGWLDLFIANESTPKEAYPCELFLNNTDGTFTEVAHTAQLTDTGFFKGVDAGDFNNDGYPDLYLSDYNGKNLLYLNGGDHENLSFHATGSYAGVSDPIFSFPTWVFDFNNDGLDDIFVSGYSNQERSATNILMANLRNPFDPRIDEHRSRLYQNNGDGTFTNVAKQVGLAEPVSTMGCNFGDLDNDGFLDFYLASGAPSFITIVPNKMYRNVEGQSFEDVTFSGGFGHIQKGHAVGFGDIDMDGDQDIYTVMGGAYEGDVYQNLLFENPIGQQNNWINILLEGTTSNRAAIGAKIIITIEENGQPRKIFHTIGTGASFGANSIRAEIGLGKAPMIKELVVAWPNRARTSTTFKEIAVNQVIKIKEGNQQVEVLPLKATPFNKEGHHHHHTK